MRNSEFESAGVSTGWNLVVLIGLLAAIALSIRWTIANGDSLWLDELHTAWAVDGGLAQVAGRAADGNQNPLFFWMTWACTQLFGLNQLSLRLVSIVAGTVTVGFAGWLTWRGSKSLTGVILTGPDYRLGLAFRFLRHRSKTLRVDAVAGPAACLFFRKPDRLAAKVRVESNKNPSERIHEMDRADFAFDRIVLLPHHQRLVVCRRGTRAAFGG